MNLEQITSELGAKPHPFKLGDKNVYITNKYFDEIIQIISKNGISNYIADKDSVYIEHNGNKAEFYTKDSLN